MLLRRICPNEPENLSCFPELARKRHDVVKTHFHTFGRDTPEFFGKVDFRPFAQAYLAQTEKGQGQQLFAPLEATKKAIAIKEFLGLICRLYTTNGGICEERRSEAWGYSPGKGLYTPRSTPKKWGCL